MALTILTWHIDFVAFAVTSLLAATLVQLWVRKAMRGERFSKGSWAMLLAVAVTACWLAISAGERESARIQEMVGGLAPTYAQEAARLGLDKITPDTDPNDPTYLQLVDAQLRWQRANPFVADIYTFGRGKDNTVCLLVDSETDYNRNGQFDGEREQRTAIGETYDKDRELIDRAFAGNVVFTPSPTTDRWGTWVSTYAPVRNAAGTVIGVLGVDYPASQWVNSILFHRGTVYGLAGIVQAVLIATAGITSAMRAEIAKRRRTEAALRASEGKLRTILDNEPECVLVLNTSGTIEEINPSGVKLLGKSQADLIATSIASYVKLEHRQRVESHLAATAAATSTTASVVEFEFATGTDGRPVWVETHSVRLCDDSGKTTSILSVARDVSARKRAEAEREALNRQLLDTSRRAGMAEVATGVLHNVGNVLNSVNISAESIADHLRSADVSGLSKAVDMIEQHQADLPQFLQQDDIGRQIPNYLGLLAQALQDEHKAARSELESLRRGIDHIKQIVRVQQSFAKGTTVVAPCNPGDIAREAVRLNSVAIDSGQIELCTELAELPDLPLDRHKILQILVNLVNNAEQAIRDGAPFQRDNPRAPRRITVRVRPGTEPDWVAFDVQDTGVGITPENLAKIFRHGFTTKSNGHGFGLHSSANAAGEMGGRLTARSDGLGKGATFTLEIPAATPKNRPPAAEKPLEATWQEAAQ